MPRCLTALVLAIVAPPVAAAQSQPIGTHCAAALCEPGTIYAVTLDSLQRQWRDSVPPRVLEALYVEPFGMTAGRRSPVAPFADLATVSKYLPGTTVVDSVSIVSSDGALRPGGTLYVFSPIDWMGLDAVRLVVARYPRHWSWGEQYFVWCERGPTGWHVTRIATGWQN
jgi:hypothetical protein